MRLSLFVSWILLFSTPGLVGLLAGTSQAISWTGANFCVAMLIASEVRPRAGVLTATSAAFLVAVLNVAFAASLFMQGTGFSYRFFFHLDLATLKIAVTAYTWPTLLAAGYLILVVGGIAHLRKESVVHLRPVFIAIALPVAGMGFLPGHSLAQYVFKFYSAHPLEALQDLKAPTVLVGQRLAYQSDVRRRNVVLIYAEQLEATYLDRDRFPEILPNVRGYLNEGLWFSDLRQYPGTGWTVASMVASQCGVPLLSRSQGNQILASVDDPFGALPCLAEFLRADGYQTVYMGGASPSFAGKGRFLSSNGFDVVLGRENFISLIPDKYTTGWGIYDDSLFEFTRSAFDKLAASKRPFLLSLLTLDTHHPRGHPSASCSPHPATENPILNAVYCTDQLLAELIEHIRNSPAGRDTVIVLISDHLAMRNTATELLESGPRRILFLILNSADSPREITKRGTHFDIAPTILDAMGYQPQVMGFGQTLLANQEGRVFELELTMDDIDSFDIATLSEPAHLPAPIEAVPGAGRLQVGRHIFLINNRGRKGSFLALQFAPEMLENPKVLGNRTQLVQAMASPDDSLWVIYSEDNRVCPPQLDCPASPYLFVGRIGQPPHLLRQAEGKLKIPLVDIEELIDLLSAQTKASGLGQDTAD